MSSTDNPKIIPDPAVAPKGAMDGARSAPGTCRERSQGRIAEPTMQKGAAKTARIPIKIAPQSSVARKPAWIRAKSPTHPEVGRLKGLLRAHRLNTVCEEARVRTSASASRTAPPPS